MRKMVRGASASARPAADYTPYPVTVTLPQTEKTVKLTGTIAVNGVRTI